MASFSDVIPNIKKNRISIIAILAFAVALCCIFAFVGNNSEESSVSNDASILSASNYSSSEETVNGYGIYVDGYFVAAALTEDSALQALDSALDARVSSLGVADAQNSFTNSVDVVKGYYKSENFVDNIDKLIAEKVFDYSGTLLPVNLSVTSVTTYTEKVIIEHDVKTIYTDSMRDGAEKVISEGFDGEGIQTYEIISVNGVETSRGAVSLEVTTEVVDEVVRVGTRSDGMSTASIGSFIKPYDGHISSYMGPRWGTTHNGIDICKNGGCFRDPALAACDGVVVSAMDKGDGYGNCVIIDHGDGVVSLYAHLDEFCCEEGDIINAGDTVGLIGNTGYSFGPHLHFEIRIDGTPVNPLMFVDYE